MSYVKIRGGFGWRIDEVRVVFVVANLMLKLCKDATFIFLAVRLCSSLADIGKNYQISRSFKFFDDVLANSYFS